MLNSLSIPSLIKEVFLSHRPTFQRHHLWTSLHLFFPLAVGRMRSAAPVGMASMSSTTWWGLPLWGQCPAPKRCRTSWRQCLSTMLMNQHTKLRLWYSQNQTENSLWFVKVATGWSLDMFYIQGLGLKNKQLWKRRILCLNDTFTTLYFFLRTFLCVVGCGGSTGGKHYSVHICRDLYKVYG